jgi:hypothetical protein
MSPVTRVVRSITLNERERLDIVRQNGDSEVILSLVEERTKIQQRTAIRLTIKQAHTLSRHLAGIAVLVEDE